MTKTEPKQTIVVSLIVIVLLCVAFWFLAWGINSLQVDGYLGGVDCCRIPK